MWNTAGAHSLYATNMKALINKLDDENVKWTVLFSSYRGELAKSMPRIWGIPGNSSPMIAKLTSNETKRECTKYKYGPQKRLKEAIEKQRKKARPEKLIVKKFKKSKLLQYFLNDLNQLKQYRSNNPIERMVLKKESTKFPSNRKSYLSTKRIGVKVKRSLNKSYPKNIEILKAENIFDNLPVNEQKKHQNGLQEKNNISTRTTNLLGVVFDVSGSFFSVFTRSTATGPLYNLLTAMKKLKNHVFDKIQQFVQKSNDPIKLYRTTPDTPPIIAPEIRLYGIPTTIQQPIKPCGSSVVAVFYLLSFTYFQHSFYVYAFHVGFADPSDLSNNPLQQLTPSNCTTERNCEDCNEKSDCTSCALTYMKIGDEGAVKCLDDCFPSQYGTFNGGNRRECKQCHPACLECEGPNNTISEDGCIRCRYGAIINNQKICLAYKNINDFNCIDGFYLDKPNQTETEWTDNICRQCHEECSTCSAAGNHPVKDKCVCKNYQILDYVTRKKICFHDCPIGFKEPPNLNQTSNILCIKCPDSEFFDATYMLCTKSYFHMLYLWLLITFCVLVLVLLVAILLYRYVKQNKVERQNTEIEDIEDTSERTRASTIKLWRAESSLSDHEKKLLFDVPHKPLDNFYIPHRILHWSETKENEIGDGCFGHIYRGKMDKDNDTQDVAIKVIKRDYLIQEIVEKEAIFRSKLQHDHVHEILGICKTNPIKLIFPLRISNLKHYLNKNHAEKTVYWRKYLFCGQIADGMAYLAKNMIIHRNLMSTSILVKGPDHVEVSSFGPVKNLNDQLANNKKDKWRWLSLECLTTKDPVTKMVCHTHASDIWAFGVTCWEIFTGCQFLPYDNISPANLQNYLESGKKLPKPSACDDATFENLLLCWANEPSKRPNFEHLQGYFSNLATKVREGKVLTNELLYKDQPLGPFLQKFRNDRLQYTSLKDSDSGVISMASTSIPSSSRQNSQISQASRKLYFSE